MHSDPLPPAVATLNACKLTGSGLRRQSRLDPRDRPEGYMECFDADTLWYDAVQTGRHLRLFCPKLNNLTSAIRSARWSVDGRPANFRRIRFCRFHDTIELTQAHPSKAQQLTVSIGSWSGGSNIAQPQPSLFAGLNTVVSMNKNNNLDWIADFVHFYHCYHGLEGVVLIDNDSTLYHLQDLQDTIGQSVSRSIIIPASFKYGPYDPKLEKPYLLLHGKLFHVEQYLQIALLNSIRLRYFSQARAILNCDIDELAYTPKTTIFDLAVKSPLGFASLPVFWRYSNPMDLDPTRHAAHRFKYAVRPEPCHAKWCIVPQGPMRWFPLFWNMHWLELEQPEKSVVLTLLSYRLSHALNYFFKKISLLFCREAKFWHFRSTTTGWKSKRKANPPQQQLILDPELQATLDKVFHDADLSVSS